MNANAQDGGTALRVVPGGRGAAQGGLAVHAPLMAGYSLPTHDLGDLMTRLDTQLFSRERRLVQYLHWAVVAGLFELIDDMNEVTPEDVCIHTPLNAGGADALLGVLAALDLATHDGAGRYRLTSLAREYFLKSSPFFIGDHLDAREPAPHPLYLRGGLGPRARLRFFFLRLLPSIRYGSVARLANQHTRNLVSCAAAVRTGEFAGVRCVVDIGGGSGTFAIPFALEYPASRVVLAELPQALNNVRTLLVQHGLEERVQLLGMDACQYPWNIPACDGIFMGNFLHGFHDETCRRFCRESFERLPSGGRIWVHELLWNDNKDGPLIAAMWNAAMRSGGPGRQRTGAQFMEILHSTGFRDVTITPTAAAFSLIIGRKP